MTLFDVVFSGNDTVYGLTESAIDAAIEKYGADKAVAFPDTAYSLPCYYGVTGVKVGNLGELKAALGVAKTLIIPMKMTIRFTIMSVLLSILLQQPSSQLRLPHWLQLYCTNCTSGRVRS